MAVVTDAFDNRNGIKHEVADSAQATVANQGDKKVTGQSPVEIKATDPFKKSKP